MNVGNRTSVGTGHVYYIWFIIKTCRHEIPNLLFKTFINQLTYLQIMSYIIPFVLIDVMLNVWKSFLQHPSNDAMLSWSVVMHAFITIVMYFMSQVLQCNTKKATEAWLGILVRFQKTGQEREIIDFQPGPPVDFIVI